MHFNAELSSIANKYSAIPFNITSMHGKMFRDSEPIRPVIDRHPNTRNLFISFLLVFGQTTIKKLVTLGSCLDFFVRLGNISFSGAWPSKQRQPITFPPISTDFWLVPH